MTLLERSADGLADCRQAAQDQFLLQLASFSNVSNTTMAKGSLRRRGSGQQAAPANASSSNKKRGRDENNNTNTSSSTLTLTRIGGAVLAALLAAAVGGHYYSPLGMFHGGVIERAFDPRLVALFQHDDEAWDKTDPAIRRMEQYLSTFVCRHGRGYCHPSLFPVPSRRTHRVIDNSGDGVAPGTILLNLPRELQIWDLDALRDHFVRNELWEARHGDTGNPLDGGAYLAAHLVRRRLVGEGRWTREEEENPDPDPMLPYLELLPTYDELVQFHPALWSDAYLHEQLGQNTPPTALVRAFRDMIGSEYAALCAASTKVFAANVKKEDYAAARINVMARSFGPGPPTSGEEDVDRYGPLDDELAEYKAKAGVDLTLGCRAMSPILDAWDSHPHPNAEWRYDVDRRAFVVWANSEKGIPSHHDVMVSYGQYSDAFLLAKFGYVNGDGTSHTEAFVNAYHTLLDVGLRQQFSYLSWSGQDVADEALEDQRRELVQYLAHDDGYEDCIRPPAGQGLESSNPDGWALKQLKFRMLRQIAYQRDRWVMRVSPRRGRDQVPSGPGFSSAVPSEAAATPPVFDMRKMRFDVSKLVATCRLIMLTNEDYGGKAQSVLADALDRGEEFASSFVVEKQTDELEYRATSCIGRLADAMLRRYPSSAVRDLKLLTMPFGSNATAEASSSSSTLQYGSKEWYAAHVRLGEMQSLEVLGGSMMQHARRLRRGMGASSATGSENAALIVRRKSCHLEHSLALLEPHGP